MNLEEQQALHILRETLDADPNVRASFIAERCAGNTALQARVEAMLGRITEEEAWPSHPSGDGVSTLDSGRLGEPEGAEDALIGSVLGSFRVTERIGRGGMGIVYRGVREDADFTQEVAIKLIRRGYDFDDVHARFLRERRILARLSHPNLARFIDGGVADDGRPWFALEFVRGQSIARWCDANRLSPKARVRLFLDVCAAVQYAHTRLVVHRDLKPGNVLVDESGTVRLLDFGVAGLLSGDTDADHLPSTLGQCFAMTPEYAAPEQFAGAPAGVPADVYSLGVLAYELVAGVLPYPIDRHATRIVARNATQLPPQNLASAIVRLTDSSSTASAARLQVRSIGLPAYRRLVRGDLNRIIDKALADEPDHRYPTVQAFADDLARWLRGAPVRVAGNRFGYRLVKFVQRNRIAVGLAGLAFLITLAGVGGVFWKSHEALREAARATAVKSFLLSLFESNTPGGATDTVPSTRDLLKRGVVRVQTQMQREPLLQAEMLTTLGSIHNQLSLYAEAEPLLRQAISLQNANPDSKAADRALTMSALAQSLTETQRYPEAIGLYEKAIPLVAGKDIAVEAKLRQLFGVTLSGGREPERGLRESREAISLWRSIPDPTGDKLSNALGDYGMVLQQAGKTEEALAIFRESLRLLKKSHGDVHSDVAIIDSNLGFSLMTLGRFDEALEPLSEAVEIDRKVYGRSHRILGIHLSNLGIAYQALGLFEQAEAVLRESIAVRASLYGEDSADVAKARNNLAVVLFKEEKFAQSESVVRSAIANLEKAEGDWRRWRVVSEGNLARALLHRDRPKDARVAVDRAMALQVEIDPDTFSKTNLDLQSILGEILVNEGALIVAEAHFQKLLDQSLAHLASNSSALPERYLELAKVEFSLGKLTEARSHFEQTLRYATQRGADKSLEAINARLGLVETLLLLDDAPAAKEQLALVTPTVEKLPINVSQRARALSLRARLEKR